MTDEQINTTALREHAAKGWGDDCLLPKASVTRMADELDSLRALLSASKPAAPEGWKLVPVELTARMRDEADFAMQNHVGDDYTESDDFDGWFQPVWSAMLAASPAAPAQSAEPVAYFVNDNAPGLKPHYSQISEQFKDHKDVLAFYTAPQPVAQTERALTREALQQKAIDHGFKYWRAPDAHGVTGTIEQAENLIADLVGVEVEITK